MPTSAARAAAFRPMMGEGTRVAPKALSIWGRLHFRKPLCFRSATLAKFQRTKLQRDKRSVLFTWACEKGHYERKAAGMKGLKAVIVPEFDLGLALCEESCRNPHSSATNVRLREHAG